jgi:catechol 2,3-dioxygenase-like lactoylglutathione lyase family enzyme
MQGIHDVTLLASNVAELRDFYERIGFKLVMRRGEDMAVFAVGGDEFVIHVGPDRATAVIGMSIRVNETGSYERRLTELGIPFEGPKPLRPGLIGIGLKDPNGNRIELVQAALAQ